MVSAEAAAGYDASQAQVVALAQREVNQVWLGIASLPAVAAKQQMVDLAVDIVTSFGPIAGSLAADFYEEIRQSEGVPTRFSAIVADVPAADRIAGSARWAAQPMFASKRPVLDDDGKVVDRLDVAPSPTDAQNRLLGSVQRHVQQAGRDTLFENGKRDRARPRWARRPDSDPCKFCNMLASRGAVYLSAETAGQFNDWHDDCNCQPEMTFDGEVSYDVDAAFQRYLDAA